MATLITIAIPVVAVAIVFGAYVKICWAIRREDRRKWSLRSAPSSVSAQVARDLVGISSSRWDQA